MPVSPPEDEKLELADVLVRLSHRVQSVFADVSREHGLTPQQAQLICRLIDGPIGMTELGSRLHLEKSSLTGLVDRAVDRGVVRRSSDPGDRRASRVGLTAAGGRLANATHRDVTARLRAMAGDLPSSDAERLVSVIAAILSTADNRLPETGNRSPHSSAKRRKKRPGASLATPAPEIS